MILLKWLCFNNTTMLTEIWKPIKGYEGLYEVSNFGRVKRLQRICDHFSGSMKIREKLIKQSRSKFGYMKTTITVNKIRKTLLTHRLVAQAFIQNPENKKTVNHKDGVKANNFWENLEWATYSENQQHAFDTGLKNSNHCKKKVKQLSKDGKLIKIWKSQVEAFKTLKTAHISDCCIGKRKTTGDFCWEYA